MKSHKFGVWGLALGAVLLSAACDDQTEVVIPTPPPDPITVSVTPASLTMQVGETAQFVATVSGGADGTARTVTWASSNQNVATVDANGIVTAVAQGVATVTATSTADNTVRAAAAVTVTPDGSTAPISISIQSITTGTTFTPVDPNNTFGQVFVTVNLEAPPPAEVDRVEVLVDGTVVYTQSFSTGGASDVAASEEAQAAVEIVATIPTAAFNATTGEVTWKNGPHTITARAIRPNGTVVATPSTTLVFNNTNFINATFSSSGPTATSQPAPRSLAAAGTLWHNGDFIVNLLSVNYDEADEAVATTTVSLTSSGYGVNGLDDCEPVDSGSAEDDPTVAVADGGDGPTNDPDGGGPLAADPAFPGCESVTAVQVGTGAVTSVTFPADDQLDEDGVENVEEIFEIAITSVTVGGQTGPVCINPDPEANPQGPTCGTYFRNPPRVDNLHPRVTQLSIERQPNQYFGPNVFELDHEAGGTVAEDGECDAPCARTVDYGVGGTEATFLAGVLGEEIAVTDGGPELEESATSEDYVFAVMVTDNTGNSETKWATDPAETGEDVSFTTDDAEDDEDILQFFGWDATNPSIEVVVAPEDMEVNPLEAVVDLLPIDESEAPAGPSGFLADPFSVKARRLLPGGTTCRNVEAGYASISCTTGGAGFRASDGEFVLPEAAGQEGYFEYTIRLADAAGNPAEEMVFWILEDRTAPEVGGINSPSTIEGGESVAFEADAEDNVELGSVTPYLGFDVVELGMPREVVGELGFDAFDDELELGVTTPRFMRSFQLNNGAGLPGAGPFMADRVVFNVRDLAGEHLRFVHEPWRPAPDDGLCPVFPAANTSTQNCTNVSENIAARVLAGSGGAVAGQFDDLAVLNGGNALHGLFTMQAPGETVVCNDEDRTDCPDDDTPTSTQLTATATGPAGSFANPFSEVRFYFQNAEGRFDYIGSASVSVTDNTVSSTRTFTYRTTWDVTAPKVRPAGVAGTVYTVYAVGINETGDGLGSTPSVGITVHGN